MFNIRILDESGPVITLTSVEELKHVLKTQYQGCEVRVEWTEVCEPFRTFILEVGSDGYITSCLRN